MRKHATLLIGLGVAVLALVAGVVIYLLTRGPRTLTAMASSATGLTSGKRRCTAAEIEQGVNTLMASGKAGGEAYAGKPPSEGEQEQVVSGNAAILTGPCLPQIEARLRQLLADTDARVRAAAKAALRSIDKARTDALRAPVDVVKNTGKSVEKGAKKVAKKVGIKL